MTHPEELLAGYVDGALEEHERVVLDAHLATCETCREEVALASRARQVLAGLPEVPMPVGVTRPVVAEVARQMAKPTPTSWRARAYAAAGLAAAAALVAVIALGNLGGVGSDAGGGGGVAEGPAPAESATAAQSAAAPLERQAIDYDPESVQELAAVAADRSAEGAAPSAEDSAAFVDDPAFECVARGSSVTPRDRLVRLIEARYEGEPAYLAVFLSSPKAGEPPDTVLVWIVAKRGCSPIFFIQQGI
ncbi:MAG: anti-sigma factor family protein [Actinomycetota bacterium]